MCGIAGVLHVDGAPASPTAVGRMIDAVIHRGPDGEGQWTDGPIGLGHRRLAIIDLSPAGRQPMASEDGSIVLSFGGEIYNFQSLRLELEALGHRFHSRTDAEVLVHGYEAWGMAVLDRLNGMFAFAIWDGRRRRLVLARDRYGVKPLYWHWDGRRLVFGSEIKSLLAHGGVRREVSADALAEYFSFQNLFSDRTLFEGIHLLPPASTLTLDAASGSTPRERRYWDYPFHAGPAEISAADAADRVHELLVQAVTRQLVADVPLGAYLSGGIDSGSIAAIAARQRPRLSTFTAGFDLSSASGLELGCDERRAAEVLANEIGSEQYEVVLHAGDMEAVLPTLIWHLEDLRVGQSYPNFYATRLASKFVRVVLSGAGGDELFGGYPWRYYRGLEGDGADDYLARYYGFWQRLVPDADKERLFTADVRRGAATLSGYDHFAAVFTGFGRPLTGPADWVDASLYFELKTFLPGLLLVEDKLSMAHGLETRVPFLDNDLVDFAVRLPAGLKLRDLASVVAVDENELGKRQRFEMEWADGKQVLRAAMSRSVPAEVVARSKQGFSAPDASWFRGASIAYIDRLLRDRRALIYDFLQPAYVHGVLDDHQAGRANRRLLIWSLISFEWWLRTFMISAATSPLVEMPLMASSLRASRGAAAAP
jgi:asparagine synthase (glutamine-hydrolysing)